MLTVTVDLERFGVEPPVTTHKLFIANRGRADAEGDKANYGVWARDPRETIKALAAEAEAQGSQFVTPPEPDAWVFAHDRADGALVLAGKAIEALQDAGCGEFCRLD